MLQKLEFMIALSREKHFGRAAESCGVAQPTFSLGIQQLEEMFNVPLVQRSSRFLGFTPEGERVLVWARRMVGDAHALRQEIFGLQRGIGSHIRLAAVPSAMAIVASITAPFQRRHPSVRFTILTRPSDQLIGLLHQREIDAGVTYVDNEPVGDVETVPLYREQYLLLTTGTGPFGDASRVRWSQLEELPLCLLTRDLQQRRIVDDILRTIGIDAAPRIETDSIVGLTSHVLTGSFVSIVSKSMMRGIDMPQALRMIPVVDPQVSHTIGLVASKRFPIQPTIASLMRDAPAEMKEKWLQSA